MKPIPLDQIGLRWRDHRSALWWLGFLYRCPIKAWQIFKQLPRHRILAASYILYAHSLPYLILLSVLGRLIIFYFFGISPDPKSPFSPNSLAFHAYSIVTGISYGGCLRDY